MIFGFCDSTIPPITKTHDHFLDVLGCDELLSLQQHAYGIYHNIPSTGEIQLGPTGFLQRHRAIAAQKPDASHLGNWVIIWLSTGNLTCQVKVPPIYRWFMLVIYGYMSSGWTFAPRFSKCSGWLRANLGWFRDSLISLGYGLSGIGLYKVFLN